MLVYSNQARDLDAGIELHIILVHLRSACQAAAAAIDLDRSMEDRMRVAWHGTFAEHNTSGDALGVKVYLRQRAQCFIGRCEIMSPVLPVDEVLEWHKRFRIPFEEKRWEPFREAWVMLMQHPKYARGRARSQEDAEAFADSKKKEKVGSPCPGRGTLSAEDLRDRDKSKATGAAERALRRADRLRKAEAHCQRLIAADEQRAHKDLLRRRRIWCSNPHLTMDEILRGPPPELRQRP